MESTIAIENDTDIKSENVQQLASMRSRLFACMIDIALIFSTLFIVEQILQMIKPSGDTHYLWVSGLCYFIYFFIMNSNLCDGATFGKRMLKIHVVDKEGKCINLGRSVLRFSFIQAFLLLQMFIASLTQSTEIVIATVSFAMFLQLSSLYLVLFNRANKQVVHDLIACTYVVYKDQSDSFKPVLFPTKHKVFMSLIFILSIGLGKGISFMVDKTKDLTNSISLSDKDINATYDLMKKSFQENPSVLETNVYKYFHKNSNQEQTTSLRLFFQVSGTVGAGKFDADSAISKSMENHPEDFEGVDVVNYSVCSKHGWILGSRYCIGKTFNMETKKSNQFFSKKLTFIMH